jgi:hypothetical protein
MRIEAVCPDCGAEHIRDQPEGVMGVAVACRCGAQFAVHVLVEPFGVPFIYAIEAIERRRWSETATNLVTSFEMFQRAAIGLLLESEGLRADVAGVIAVDLRLSRDDISKLARAVLGATPPSPNVGRRNVAVHQGRAPKRQEVERGAAELLGVFDHWLEAISQRFLLDHSRLWLAYDAFGPLPQDVSASARKAFDLCVTRRTLGDRWGSYLARAAGQARGTP